MFKYLDTMQIILWSLTYVLIILSGLRNKSEKLPMMPFLSGNLNFAWEINAFIQSGGFWGHYLWLGLDLIIYLINSSILRTTKLRTVKPYLFQTIALTLLLFVCFRLPPQHGTLLSCFTIDLIMAAEYVFKRKQLSPHCQVPIAITKLLGDFCAWLAYFQHSFVVAIIGAVVFCLNSYYLFFCIQRRKLLLSAKDPGITPNL